MVQCARRCVVACVTVYVNVRCPCGMRYTSCRHNMLSTIVLHVCVRVVEHSGLKNVLSRLQYSQRRSQTRQHAYRDALALPPAAFVRTLRMKLRWTFRRRAPSQIHTIRRQDERKAAPDSAGNGCFSSAAASAGVSASMDERNTRNESVGFGELSEAAHPVPRSVVAAAEADPWLCSCRYS